ncbi:MAG: hypothetical protein ACI81W_001304 [Saprospiraceae bacterium]|jgi:hypothetical protein
MKTSIKVNIVSSNLSETTKEQMWDVYRQYYHYTREEFIQKIAKNNFYYFYTVNGQIIGFTGLRINRTKVQGKRQLLIYFGQTVVREDYRGKSLIPITGAKLCMKYWKEMLFSDVYFWADALTYKAYLVFAKSVEEMSPSRKRFMPDTIKAIVDHLGMIHYGNTYCAATGTIQKQKVLVNDTTMQIREKYTADEDIRFYLKANLLFNQGHGLVTITPMNLMNARKLLKRYILKIFGWKVVKRANVLQTV